MGPPRSSTTGHVLLPAFNNRNDRDLVPVATTANLLSWTFGRGTVIWRIWPAVVLHTVFAAAVVTISLRTKYNLGIPNVMLTLLGVVIGFVISYRASSGYDRYWQGRSAWSDIARTTRTFSRLIWIHVPLKLELTQAASNGKYPEIDIAVARHVMSEKRVALDLLEGLVIAVKHHLRGEPGIYYEDLYPLVRPLHDHAHHRRPNKQPTVQVDTAVPTSHPELPPSALLGSPSQDHPPSSSKAQRPSSSVGVDSTFSDPAIPPLNTYGTFVPSPLHVSRSLSSLSDMSSEHGERRPLLPGAVQTSSERRGVFGSVSTDLIPFAAFLRSFGPLLDSCHKHVRSKNVTSPLGFDEEEGGIQRRWAEDDANGVPITEGQASGNQFESQSGTTKHRPRIAGGGDNLPLEILRSLSVWLSVLDERGIVPGAVLGGMFGCVAAFEDSLSTLERILTTPLPFVYSVHIRTVWIYLFFLPFQLIDLFGWYAIPGVGIAAFIYLGLVAAGEEIEQPFGYDENDLDLDFFCRAIVRADLERIRRVSCPNAYLGAHHVGTHIPSSHDAAVDTRTKVDALFGGGRHL